jgi:cystathionine beta-lyase
LDFNFDEEIDRTGTGSVKWAAPSRLPANTMVRPLPMWIADMDFRAPREVLDAIHRAVDHGIFGYDNPLPGFYESVVDWQRIRHQWAIKPEWIVLTPSVVAALYYVIQTFSQPGDSVLMQMPVYRPFHLGPRINDRRVIGVPLEWDGHGYGLDPDRFRKAIAPGTKLFILCNPHNPVGKVWSAEELRTMGEICLEHGVLVVSDEIHQDFVLNREMRHIPFAGLGEEFAAHSIICTAPSKTFNLAGLRMSYTCISNPRLRTELKRALERTGVHHPNSLGWIACEAAYRKGAPWLDALLDYLRANHALLAGTLADSIPEIKVAPADSLYLAWLDCRALGMGADELNDFMLRDAGLCLNRGDEFGPGGEGHMRMNLACPRKVLKEALTRLQTAVEQWRAKRKTNAEGAKNAEEHSAKNQ